MSTTTIAALPHLAALQQNAARVNRKGDALRFRFRRQDPSKLDAVQALADMGVPVKVYTGGKILSFRGGKWTTRNTSVLRAHMTVEVAL